MVVQELRRWGAPWQLVLIVLLLRWSPHLQQMQTLAFCELFAGHCQVSTGLRSHGYVGHSQDITYTVTQRAMNLLGDAGFALCVLSALRLEPGVGLHFSAPVCSSWIFLSRSQSRDLILQLKLILTIFQ